MGVMRASRRYCAAPVSSTNPMPPCTCTPSEATSMPVSVDQPLTTGIIRSTNAWCCLRALAFALDPILGERQRALEGALGDRHAFEADRETRGVHHDDHVLQAAVFLADDIANRLV